MRGPSKQSAEQLLGNFGRALEEQARWTTNAGSGSKSRTWSFRDLEGRTWRGTLTVEPVIGATGEYTARLAVAKSS